MLGVGVLDHMKVAMPALYLSHYMIPDWFQSIIYLTCLLLPRVYTRISRRVPSPQIVSSWNATSWLSSREQVAYSSSDITASGPRYCWRLKRHANCSFKWIAIFFGTPHLELGKQIHNLATLYLQVKTPGTAVFATQYYLSIQRKEHPESLAKGSNIIGDVLIHPTAKVCRSFDKIKYVFNFYYFLPFIRPDSGTAPYDLIRLVFQVSSSAVLGPNVTIGANTVVKDGVRIKHSILLDGCEVRSQSEVTLYQHDMRCTLSCE